VPVFVIAALVPEEGVPGLGLLESLVSMLAGLVVTGALTFGVLQSLHGRPVTVGALMGSGFGKLGRVFLVSFGVGIFVLLGSLLLVVPGVMAYCALFVAIPAVVVEQDLLPSDALSRSRALTKGSRWGIFVVALVVLVVTVVLGVAGEALAAAGSEALPHPIPVLLATVAIALASALGATASAVAYHDLRVAREGIATADLVKVFE